MVWALYLEQVPPSAHAELAERVAQPWAPLRATHGATPADRRAAKAMMDLAGGPAAPRPPKP